MNKTIPSFLSSIVLLSPLLAADSTQQMGPNRDGVVPGDDRALPKPLPEHPGNVFLAGEEVVVPLPGDWTGAWRVLDYDGRQLAEGKGPGKINLGKLPVGYYEIPREDGKPPIGIGVLELLAAPTPKTSPIGVDASVPWSLGNKLPEAANLCALAGINWARGRLNWTQMEPQQGQFARPNNYDAAARELSKAGIQMLQVNHRQSASPKRQGTLSLCPTAWASERKVMTARSLWARPSLPGP